MAQMAKGVELLHGEFTPSDDVSSYTIDPGRDVSFILVQCKSAVIISGVRNTAYIIAFVDNGQIQGYGSCSNAVGSSWGGSSYWSSTNASNTPIVKNGTSYTFTPSTFASGAKFYASRSYEWYAM